MHVQVVSLIRRAMKLGIRPNLVMYNTAINALGNAKRVDVAQALFHCMPKKDIVSYETLLLAYGSAGDTRNAERLFLELQAAGMMPRDYAYCGLILAYRYAPGTLHCWPSYIWASLIHDRTSQLP
jgi:pentatricopeptide repeat protein